MSRLDQPTRFTEKAQTYDHVLTMQTISSKYKKLKKPVFAIFVEFCKAFDSVCRQALFFNLALSKPQADFTIFSGICTQTLWAKLNLRDILAKALTLTKEQNKDTHYLYARYLCSRDALGLKAARPSARATIGYLVYKPTITRPI